MTEKHKNACRGLNYFQHVLVFLSAISDYVSIFAFASLVCVPVGIKSSVLGLKICGLTAGIKKYKSVIKKMKEDDKIVLLGKAELATIEVMIYIIHMYISYDEFVSVNYGLRAHNKIKEEIKNPQNGVEYII